MKLFCAINETEAKLKSADTSAPRLEAELIVSNVIGLPRLELPLNRTLEVTKKQTGRINVLTARRMRHEPLQYVFKEAYFRNLRLKVGSGVLIPRPETEILVEYAMKLAPKNAFVCDIGTGSGAIALAIAQERPDCNVTGIDISDDALKFARENRRMNKIKNVRFRKGNLLKGINRKFTIITANLPYINRKDFLSLPCEIRKYEPSSALLAGEDGLKFIKKLISTAHRNLLEGGILILEISPEQESAIQYFFDKTKKYTSIEFTKDLCGKIRFCIITQ
ncbi:MAG: peptide chain release factor N(5)-glutamine methyltransferase [Lentisphaerae bacterium]|nr:peptide chain release factor N(5)-glutamine methyltransferase [Lentisphaerota bacterium]